MKNVILCVVCGILIILISTALALGIILSTDFIYKFDVDYLSIPETSGLPRDEVLENTEAMMDYLNPFSTKDFSLPTLTFSEQGASHFSDCRNIFRCVFLAGALSLAAFSAICIIFRRDLRWLRGAGIISALLPIVCACVISLGFDRAFVYFHLILFKSDTWIFDEIADPIINLLPQEYFFHCALFILAVCVISGAVAVLFSTVKRKNNSYK